MSKKTIGAIVIALLCIFSRCTFAEDTSATATPGTDGITKTQAVQIAQQITGINLQYTNKVPIKDEVLTAGDNPPFLALTGHPIWHITITNFLCTVPNNKNGQKVQNKSITSLSVLIDKKTGQLIKIISSTPFGMKEDQMKNREADEVDLRRSFMIYEGLPTNAPAITFMQALQNTHKDIGAPLLATQIEAYYVLLHETANSATAHPRWMITFRNLPTPFHREHENKNQTSVTIRYEIDSVSGNWIEAGNIPDLSP